MNILVCIKQVPDTTEVKINPETNTLIRDGVPSIVNPFDVYALEAAARLKDEEPDTTIAVLCMGPNQAKTALKECLSIAADKAYLASDWAFGGSDTLATSYILATCIRKIESVEGPFDAIFCGKQAIDGDTAQVGPEIAEHLDYPQVTYGLKVSCDGERLKVLQEGDGVNRLIGVKMPCVVTFSKPSFEPRYPTVQRCLRANRAEIGLVTAADLPGIDGTRIGLKGSPTKVKWTFVPKRDKNGIVIEENSGSASAAKLSELLSSTHVI